MRSLAAIIIALTVAQPIFAQQDDRDQPNIFYDIYVEDSCLTVWVDLAPFLTARTLERMQDGIELAIELRAELVSPRRFWGDQSFVTRTRTFKLSFRKITGEFVLSMTGPDRKEVPFLSKEELSSALSDSAYICLDRLSQLSSDRRYAMALEVTTISLTDLNLAQVGRDSAESESAVRFLFRQFLRLTDYGRQKVTTKSRPFLLRELEELD